MSSRAENTRLATIASRLKRTGLEKVYENTCCGYGVPLTFLAVMRCSLIFFCGVAVFRTPPCPPQHAPVCSFGISSTNHSLQTDRSAQPKNLLWMFCKFNYSASRSFVLVRSAFVVKCNPIDINTHICSVYMYPNNIHEKITRLAESSAVQV